MTDLHDPRFATTLARGLSVLRAFRVTDDGLSNAEIAQRTGLPKSTVSRLTFTLGQLGYLVQSPRDDRFRPGPTLVAVGPQASAERTGALREAGCSVWASPPAEGGNGAVNLPALLDHAGSLGIDSILVEGGPALHGAFIDGGLANRVQAYIAPKLFGGASAPGPVASSPTW